jgi:hypothetical protein
MSNALRVAFGVAPVAALYGTCVYLEFEPERTTSWPEYLGILLPGEFVLIVVEAAVEKFGGSDRGTDPLGKRVLALVFMLLAGAAGFAMLYWRLSRARLRGSGTKHLHRHTSKGMSLPSET